MLGKAEGNILSRVLVHWLFIPKFKGKPFFKSDFGGLLSFGCFPDSFKFFFAKCSVIVRLAIPEAPKILWFTKMFPSWDFLISQVLQA